MCAHVCQIGSEHSNVINAEILVFENMHVIFCIAVLPQSFIDCANNRVKGNAHFKMETIH